MSTTVRVCHERVLPSEMFRPQSTVRRGGTTRAVFVWRKMWVTGSRLRVRFLDGTSEQQRIAREQASWWTEHANLSFAFTNDLDAEIRITFDPDDGAWSYVGTDCSSIARHLPTMNLGFLDGGTPAHEFGHAIGLAHEHQNPSPGIQWNEAVVIRDLAKPPNQWTEEEARHNVLDRYRSNQIRGTNFDPHSIMLYFFPDSWVQGGKGTKENHALSDLDKAFIGSREAYPHAAKPYVDLKVGARTSTRADIGKPGEEDVYRFHVTRAGNHVIRTGGKTDVVLKLFGPNSSTRLIAEDDDSGVGLNARIKALLVPGEYIAQVRHAKKGATGTYTIRVTRD